MNQVRYKGSWGYVIKKDFVCNELSIGAKMLYIAIKAYCSPHGNTAFPSTETLADHLNVSRMSVNRYAKELEAGGWLKREQTDRKNGRFTNTLWTIYGSNALESLPCNKNP